MSINELITHSRPSIDENDVKQVISVLTSGNLVQGEKVLELESKMASYLSLPGAAAVSSGLAALHLALLAFEIGTGDEVIIPSFVCTALWHAVTHTGARPVICDIDPVTYNIDIHHAKSLITARTKAIIVPYMFGLSIDIEPLKNLDIKVKIRNKTK